MRRRTAPSGSPWPGQTGRRCAGSRAGGSLRPYSVRDSPGADHDRSPDPDRNARRRRTPHRADHAQPPQAAERAERRADGPAGRGADGLRPPTTAIGCIVITGSEKAFAAGADIGAMATLRLHGRAQGDFITRNWETLLQVRKPVIAAVAGFALGGGCELAMMCDFIIAADSARSASPRSSSASSPVPAARSACRAPWARPRPWTWC
jgi:hypothetical protein